MTDLNFWEAILAGIIVMSSQAYLFALINPKTYSDRIWLPVFLSGLSTSFLFYIK